MEMFWRIRFPPTTKGVGIQRICFMKKHHTYKEREHFCWAISVSTKNFENRNMRVKMVKAIRKKKKYVCPICGEKFRESDQAKEHSWYCEED